MESRLQYACRTFSMNYLPIDQTSLDDIELMSPHDGWTCCMRYSMSSKPIALSHTSPKDNGDFPIDFLIEFPTHVLGQCVP